MIPFRVLLVDRSSMAKSCLVVLAVALSVLGGPLFGSSVPAAAEAPPPGAAGGAEIGNLAGAVGSEVARGPAESRAGECLTLSAGGTINEPMIPISDKRVGGSIEQRPDQRGAWEGVTLDGASCGRGSGYKYYINVSDDPSAGLFFLLNGGGACLKEGPAPSGVSGAAKQLYCMDYTNFVDVLATDVGASSLPLLIRYFRRYEEDNPFRDYTYVFVPYCTGDVHAGRMSEPYDYDPDPATRFDVTHRGHLNVLAVLEDVYARFSADVPVVLTGVSAGGFGAIFNYPEFAARWPHTALLPDAGIAPPHPDSLMVRYGQTVAERWGAPALLPSYCSDDACLADTMRLLYAHAGQYDGSEAPWRPFGFLQGQQDSVLANYLEISRCSYQLGLRKGLAASRPSNLRAYIPQTTQHVFGASPNYESPVYGVDMLEWFAAVATASTVDDLPADVIEPWYACHALLLPALHVGY